jgi:hypothetical protein
VSTQPTSPEPTRCLLNDLTELSEPPSDDDQPQAASYEIPPLRETAESEAVRGFGAVNPFFAHPMSESVHIAADLLTEQQIGSLTADWNLGKTPLKQQLALSVGAGLPFLGRPTTKRPVIVLDGETSYPDYRGSFERIAKRLAVGPRDIVNLRFFLRYGAVGDPDSEAFRAVIGKAKDAVAFIRKQLERFPNALVLIDPLMEIIPFKETDPFAALGMYHQLREILADFPRAAILFTLHLRKGTDDPKNPFNSASSGKVLLRNPRRWFKEVAGTNKIGAHADVRLGMCAVTHDEQHLVIKGFRRGKDVVPLSFVRSINIDGEYDGFLEHPLPKDVLIDLSEEQKKQLAKLPFPFRFNEVADRGGGLPRASLHRLLKAALNAGYVNKDQHQVWHRDVDPVP